LEAPSTPYPFKAISTQTNPRTPILVYIEVIRVFISFFVALFQSPTCHYISPGPSKERRKRKGEKKALGLGLGLVS